VRRCESMLFERPDERCKRYYEQDDSEVREAEEASENRWSLQVETPWDVSLVLSRRLFGVSEESQCR
jgi:hypothetical protein